MRFTRMFNTIDAIPEASLPGPIVSPVTQVPGLFIAARHEGEGIGLAPVTGHLTTDLMLGRQPIVDPGPLPLGRLAGQGVL